MKVHITRKEFFNKLSNNKENILYDKYIKICSLIKEDCITIEHCSGAYAVTIYNNLKENKNRVCDIFNTDNQDDEETQIFCKILFDYCISILYEEFLRVKKINNKAKWLLKIGDRVIDEREYNERIIL